jgi:hypothetical protein
LLKRPEGKTAVEVMDLLLTDNLSDFFIFYVEDETLKFNLLANRKIDLLAAKNQTIEYWKNKFEYLNAEAAGKIAALQGQIYNDPMNNLAYLNEVSRVKSTFQTLANALGTDHLDQDAINRARENVDQLIPQLSPEMTILVNTHFFESPVLK